MPESLITPAALWTWCGLSIALGIVTALMSALLERSGVIRLRHWAEEAGGSIQDCYQDGRSFEAFGLLLNMISRLSVVGVFAFSARATGRVSIALLLTSSTLLLAEYLSRRQVGSHSEEALERLTSFYRLALFLLRPFVAVLRPLFQESAEASTIAEGEIDEASEGEIDAFISVGTREGILEPGEEELVKGVVEFGDTLVKSAMTPRIDMVSAPVVESHDRLLDLFLDSGHSRIPLYGASPDHIVGILHLRDLVAAMRQANPPAPDEISMPAYVVPETKPIAELLRELQARRLQLAIAVDEFGGTAGVVTIEDLLEEIVGDIADEHEERDFEKTRLGEQRWELSGSFDVEELEELFAVEIDDVPYETVGGLVFTALGHLPDAGERVRRHGLEFEVREVEDRRIQRVRVSPSPEVENEED